MRNFFYRYIFLVTILPGCIHGQSKVISPNILKDTASRVLARHDTSTIDIHDPYETGRDTVRVNEAMDKILRFPEVRAAGKRISKASNGTHGVSIIVSDEFEGDTAYYYFRVGDNSHKEMYFTIFDFLLEKKTGQIKAYDPVLDSIISLRDWRRKKINR